MTKMTLEDLMEILAECAGEDEDIDRTDVLNSSFDQLGYDSLAVLEAAAAVQLRFGVPLPDDVVASMRSPGEFLERVNQLAEQLT